MDLSTWPAAARDVLEPARHMELGPGRPDEKMRPRLAALAPLLVESLGRDSAETCLAALWLYHDFLDESHTLSQSIKTPEGSYWHGIMHRREPDAGNAAYWFRRVGNHPVFAGLAQAAQATGLALKGGRWDPFTFIDRCEEHRGRGTPEEATLRRLQQREWELLFDWCLKSGKSLD